MRIVLVTVNKSIYASGIIDTLIRSIHNDIVGIVTSSKRTHSAKPLIESAIHELQFNGCRDFIVLGLLHLRRIALDSIRHVLPVRSFYSTEAVAEHYSIPFYPCQNINEPDFLEFLLHELNPDVIVSMQNPQIFKKTILGLPRLGCINVHPSLLPKYRGPAPIFWVLAYNEVETGVTVHYMDEKIDNGDIILQSRVTIRPEDTMHSLYRRVMSIGATLVLQALEQLEAGTVSTTPNDVKEATYYPYPSIEEGRRLRQSGRKIL